MSRIESARDKQMLLSKIVVTEPQICQAELRLRQRIIWTKRNSRGIVPLRLLEFSDT